MRALQCLFSPPQRICAPPTRMLPMKTRNRLPLFAIALSLATPALAQQAQDFSLPPAPAPSATQRAQGPVDTESGVLPVRPRVIATATPTPAASTAPQPVATQTPAVSAPATANPGPSTPASRTAAPASSQQASAAQPAPIERQPVVPQELPPVAADESAFPAAVPSPSLPSVNETQASVDEAAGGAMPDWLWPALGGVLLALLAGGWLFMRRRANRVEAPEIERPVVATVATPQPSAPPTGDTLIIRCQAEKLTRSAVYATLKYQLTLVNRTDVALSDVSVGVDLVSAHSGAPMEEQVATATTALEKRHSLARIAPRQNVTVEGQVQLPLASAQVIFQGRHPLLVPLLRVRVDGAGESAQVKTFVVGQGVPDGGRVQPFRLDEPPRSYAPIAQRELA